MCYAVFGDGFLLEFRYRQKLGQAMSTPRKLRQLPVVERYWYVLQINQAYFIYISDKEVRNIISDISDKFVRMDKILKTKMLTINEKYICAYNKHTSQHYIKCIDLEPYILTFNPFIYQYPYNSPNKFNSPNNHIKTQQFDNVRQLHQPAHFSNSEGSSIFSQLQSNAKQNNLDQDDLANSMNHDFGGSKSGEGKKEQKEDKIMEKGVKVVNFKEVFELLGIFIELCVIKEIYIPEADQYFQFQELSDIANCVPTTHTTHEVILLRFTSITDAPHLHLLLPQPPAFSFFEPHHHSHQNFGCLQQQTIKQRDRSRTIKQILEYVRKWRYLAQEGINGRKLNLQEAAHYIGVPKKSLDDYFYQVRVGEKYEFDFQQNSHRNISFLRKFVKSKVPHRQRMNFINKNQQSSPAAGQQQKLPKKLKQPQHSTQSNMELQHIKMGEGDRQSQKCRISDSQISSIEPIWPNNIICNQNIFDEQDSFFNNFKQGNDNFVGFRYLRDKANENQNQNQNEVENLNSMSQDLNQSQNLSICFSLNIRR